LVTDSAGSSPRASQLHAQPASFDRGTATTGPQGTQALTAFALGFAGLAIATVAIFSPRYGPYLSFVACAVAALAGLAGDRFLAAGTPLMAVINWFLLNPAIVYKNIPLSILAAIFFIAPFVTMTLRGTGRLSLAGGPAGAAPLPRFIQNPQDFIGGLALLELAIVAFRATADLPGQQGFAFGPGTAPRLFIALLGLNALAIMATGVFASGPPLDRFHVRGPMFITAGVLVFAATIRPLGLIISSFLLVCISSIGTAEVRWKETLIWAAILSAFCAFLFPYVLNLPMQLWPRF
jgi:putative tricarboxylic transport membrane protein